MSEPFSPSKFFGSFIQPIGWVKSLSLGLKLFILLWLAFTIYKAYFTKTQTQHNVITVQPGGTVNVGQSQDKKKLSFTTGFWGGATSDGTMVGGMYGGIAW